MNLTATRVIHVNTVDYVFRYDPLMVLFNDAMQCCVLFPHNPPSILQAFCNCGVSRCSSTELQHTACSYCGELRLLCDVLSWAHSGLLEGTLFILRCSWGSIRICGALTTWHRRKKKCVPSFSTFQQDDDSHPWRCTESLSQQISQHTQSISWTSCQDHADLI